MLAALCEGLRSESVSVPPGNVVNSVHDWVAERVASDLQHAACDEQEEQEDAAHDHDQVHPHALPVRDKETESNAEKEKRKRCAQPPIPKYGKIKTKTECNNWPITYTKTYQHFAIS